jgi:hypothetical protein
MQMKSTIISGDESLVVLRLLNGPSWEVAALLLKIAESQADFSKNLCIVWLPGRSLLV